MERVALGSLACLYKRKQIHSCLTKWTEAIAIHDQEAYTIIAAFVNGIVCRFGTPLQIHSDQGRNFESKAFREMCEILHIDKT